MMLTFSVDPFNQGDPCTIFTSEAAGLELPCFISLSLVPTLRPDILRALFLVEAGGPA
jgi:hypothetical protein